LQSRDKSQIDRITGPENQPKIAIISIKKIKIILIKKTTITKEIIINKMTGMIIELNVGTAITLEATVMIKIMIDKITGIVVYQKSKETKRDSYDKYAAKVICYRCNKTGHYAYNCEKFKKMGRI